MRGRSTETLLTLRDGGPIDRALRDELRNDPDAAAELERLRRVKVALRTLPQLEPRDGNWERIAAELDRSDVGSRSGSVWRAVFGGAIAAGVLIAALQLAVRPVAPRLPAPPPSPRVAETAQVATVAEVVPAAVSKPLRSGRPILPPSYVALVAESERLERLLARIPNQRPMMTVRTASTIVGLEDRIADVDTQILFASASDMDMPVREALWSERVELMNALVHVRFAQAGF